MNNTDALGLQTTTVSFGGAEVTLTHNDALAIEQALLAYLASADVSQVEDRDYLVADTKGGPSWIGTDGILRVSSWVLQSGPHGLILRYRMPSPEGAEVVHAYVATLVRENSWRVVSIASERIWRRR